MLENIEMPTYAILCHNLSFKTEGLFFPFLVVVAVVYNYVLTFFFGLLNT